MELLAALDLAMLVLMATWLLIAWGAALIASNKGESALKWFVASLFIGPFAWVGAYYSGKICPHCRSKIHQKALVCPRCQRPQTYQNLEEELRTPPEALIAQNQPGTDR